VVDTGSSGGSKELRVGDARDFWHVETVEPGRLLRLQAEMKVPGEAWRQLEARPLEEGRTLLEQAAFLAPRGLLDFLYQVHSRQKHSRPGSSQAGREFVRSLRARRLRRNTVQRDFDALHGADRLVHGTTLGHAQDGLFTAVDAGAGQIDHNLLQAAINTMARVVKPGGWVIACEDEGLDRRFEEAGLERVQSLSNVPEHVYCHRKPLSTRT
jgi:hypothetical protein